MKLVFAFFLNKRWYYVILILVIFMTNKFRASFHDQELIDIKKENNDVIIVANDEESNEYMITIKNAKIETNADFDILDVKGAFIMGMSYHETDDGIQYIHLETESKHVPFYDEMYFYSKNIIITKK